MKNIPSERIPERSDKPGLLKQLTLDYDMLDARENFVANVEAAGYVVV